MDAKKVKVILKAIERGSLKAAAEENGYTPSGLSHLLQNMEDELGVTLAERKKNRGQPTRVRLLSCYDWQRL